MVWQFSPLPTVVICSFILCPLTFSLCVSYPFSHCAFLILSGWEFDELIELVTRDRVPTNMSSNWQPQVPAKEINAGPVEGSPDWVNGSESESPVGPRKKVVVIGLGMVGISFMLVIENYKKEHLLTCRQWEIDEARCEATRIRHYCYWRRITSGIQPSWIDQFLPAPQGREFIPQSQRMGTCRVLSSHPSRSKSGFFHIVF